MKPYFSPSSLDLFFRCPEAFRRRYILGERRPPGIAAIRGSGVHWGARTNFAQKVYTREDLPRSAIVEASVAGFEERLESEGEVDLSPEERSRGRRIVLAEAKDSTAVLGGLHADEQAPHYQPEWTEQTVRLEVPGASRDLLGVIDCFTTDRKIVDLKTSNKKKQENEAHASVQLTAYAGLVYKATGQPASGIALDVLVATKQPYRQLIETGRDGPMFQALAARINVAVDMIERMSDLDIWPGASPTADWYCSERFCGYARDCKLFAIWKGER